MVVSHQLYRLGSIPTRSSSSAFPPSTPSSVSFQLLPGRCLHGPRVGCSPGRLQQLGELPARQCSPPSLLGCSPCPGASPAYSVLLPVELLTATPGSILFRTSSLRASSRFPGISVPKEPPPAFSRAGLVHRGKTQPLTLSLAKSTPLLCSGPPAARGPLCLLPHAESGCGAGTLLEISSTSGKNVMPTQSILSMPSSQWALLGSHHLPEALNTDHSAFPLPPVPTAPVGTAPRPQDGGPHSGLRNFPCWLEASPCSHH